MKATYCENIYVSLSTISLCYKDTDNSDFQIVHFIFYCLKYTVHFQYLNDNFNIETIIFCIMCCIFM